MSVQFITRLSEEGQNCMDIRGSFVAAHLIRELFAKEYAFFLFWDDDVSLVVGHRKGIWTLAKTSQKGVEWCSLSDEGDYVTDNDLLAGLITQRFSSYQEKYPLLDRNHLAHILSDVITLWVGPLSDILRVECVQEGRNSTVRRDGTLSLAPAPQDWKK